MVIRVDDHQQDDENRKHHILHRYWIVAELRLFGRLSARIRLQNHIFLFQLGMIRLGKPTVGPRADVFRTQRAKARVRDQGPPKRRHTGPHWWVDKMSTLPTSSQPAFGLHPDVSPCLPGILRQGSPQEAKGLILRTRGRGDTSLPIH